MDVTDLFHIDVTKRFEVATIALPQGKVVFLKIKLESSNASRAVTMVITLQLGCEIKGDIRILPQ